MLNYIHNVVSQIIFYHNRTLYVILKVAWKLRGWMRERKRERERESARERERERERERVDVYCKK